ncbi:pentatricopeptide repeat-containing protein at4g19220 mitochondrial [Phtheirospermum japonicum]|uniref:Pentatricopeptide repeat-containing protein at4g19220 mitochondrial n=1 Tax=Phtheirospermum japonicum TaxID=374723 RepID=A0A830B6X2_9LAMI|nr:pentatricopeptide repeat-containing protein at4g19220 mitochondrial [Phtheirospermum japonicum]
MPHRKHHSEYNAFTWDASDTIHSAIVQQPNYSNAPMLHALAVKQSALADLRTATSLLTVYSKTKDLESSLALFGETIDKDIVFWNAMMSACIENKRFQSVIDLFKKMVNGGGGFDSTTLLIALSAFSDSKSVANGRVVHGSAIKSGMRSDTALGNAVIDMYAKCGDLRSAERAFDETESKDLISWNSIVTACFHNSRPDKSLSYFAHMARFGNRPDDTTISCAMSACACLHVFALGLSVHGLGIKLGYTEDKYTSVANSLISFYSQSRDIHAGEFIFYKMVFKNVVSWNAMIKGFLVNEEIARAFCLLREMQFVASIEPDITTLVTVIPFCAERMLVREGKAFHGFVVRREMMSELSVVNSLINMYLKCGNVKRSEFLFSAMPNKDSVSWNTMILGYAQNGESYKAKTLFKKMMGFYSSCTLPTLLAVIPSCDSRESVRFGRSIHGWSVKSGYSNQIFAMNSLVQMYISCDVLTDALALFGMISNKSDISSWNTVIVGCAQKGRFREALEYFDSMRTKTSLQARFNSVTLVSVISSCGNLGLSIHGKLIHGFALKTGLSTNLQVQNSLVTMYGRLGDPGSAKLAFDAGNQKNLCSWNCLISAASRNEDARIALEVFRSLEFEPNEITISTVLSACTHLGAVSYGKQIHGHVLRVGLCENPFISAALSGMYSNCGRLDIAERVFFRSSSKRSVAAWNSMISAYGFHSLVSKAIETFREMIGSGIRPTNGSFTSLLSACSHAGMIDEGLMYYEHMLSRFDVEPSVEHHVCMVDMLGRAGRIDEAYDFIKSLKRESGPGVWGALLSACGYHGDIEMGKKVADILFSLEPGNVSYYVALCNMYVAAGKWEEAVELRNMIQEKKLRKEVGYSLIDVGVR